MAIFSDGSPPIRVPTDHWRALTTLPATRSIIRLWPADGRIGWGKGTVLLNALPALLEQLLLQIALTKLVNRTSSSGELISQSRTLRSRMPPLVEQRWPGLLVGAAKELASSFYSAGHHARELEAGRRPPAFAAASRRIAISNAF